MTFGDDDHSSIGKAEEGVYRVCISTPRSFPEQIQHSSADAMARIPAGHSVFELPGLEPRRASSYLTQLPGEVRWASFVRRLLQIPPRIRRGGQGRRKKARAAFASLIGALQLHGLPIIDSSAEMPTFPGGPSPSGPPRDFGPGGPMLRPSYGKGASSSGGGAPPPWAAGGPKGGLGKGASSSGGGAPPLGCW